jgi:hypothetical protein
MKKISVSNVSTDMHRRLRYAVGRKRFENQQLVSPSRQCSSKPVGSGQGFLSKVQCGDTGAYPILSRTGYS